MEEVKELLNTILRGIVAHPDSLQITETEETDDKGTATVLTVTPHQEDVGLCIGVKGNNAQAIRRVIGLYAMRKCDLRVFVKIDSLNSNKGRYDYEN